MFQHLPTITEESYKVFVDRELLEVLNNINDYMGVLKESNKYLAQAIHAGAETVSEYFSRETKEVVKSDAVAAQLAVLRLIDRALEAQSLEAELLKKNRLAI